MNTNFNDNLIDTTDEELENLPIPDTPPEFMEILRAETIEERVKLYKKYFGEFSTDDIKID